MLNQPKDSLKPALNKQHSGQETILYDLGEFTVNLSDIAANRFLKVGIILEFPDPQAQNEEFMVFDKISDFHKKKILERDMAKHNPKIKDAIISLLSSKTREQLLSNEGKELVKDQILNEVNFILNGEKEVVKVDFNPFIMQ